MTELRVYIQIKDLQPQLAAYMGSPIRARGYPPVEGSNSIIKCEFCSRSPRFGEEMSKYTHDG